MTPLHLLAEDPADVRLIAACAQDSILSSADVRLEREEGVAALALSRFRWEDRGLPSRVRSLLVVRGVTGAARLRWPRAASPLELLTLGAGGGWVRLDFADGIGMRLAVERVRVSLEDVGEPWRVRRRPSHRG